MPEQVRHEAKKLSETFKKIALSMGDLNDLTSMEPVWDSPVTSDAEEDDVGLPQLKLYHVNRKNTTDIGKSAPIQKKPNSLISEESDALRRFKNRYRNSLDSSAALDNSQVTQSILIHI